MAWISDHVARRTWDPDRGLTIRCLKTRFTDVFTIIEREEPVIWFDGTVRSGRWLSEEEQSANPGFRRLETWEITADSGVGPYADKATRRAMIVEFLECFQTGGGFAMYDPYPTPVFAKIEVLFDRPFRD
jgi:hypothetical protein